MDQLNNSVIREPAAGDVNMRETARGAVGGGEWRGEGVARDVTAFLLQSYHSPSKVLKLEDDPWGSCAMYSPDKMKSGGGLMAPPGCFPGRYSPTYRSSDPRRCVPNPSVGNMEANIHTYSRILEDASLMCNSWSPRHNMGHHGMEGLDMLDPLTSSSMTTLAPMGEAAPPHHQLHGYGAMNHVMNHHHHAGGLAHAPPAHLGHPSAALHPDTDTDPRELEAFAERFKQRRIKLGVTQADVGKALANLKLPGVGALSQSTICRFESLTLSHNNMIALKPILQAWLEEAEAQAKNKRRDPDAPSVLPAGEKKRKRTSIAAPEKRSLEAYFAVQPRPSGEKITAIAEKLDLKKNVVRVWFCNQRQKQKRMKFAAQH
ncbi:hypothetical protein B5X24_HaOG207411 [Helicoverpa armigera]|uniref:POU domain protein n=1 Tax=Helicoverpa armigera TaxID=29058 RepID=A0A2W1BPG4_HELAM|nr:hypothetical protein B5X24_HaOG207411 [Helicoverpa armigera]